MKSFGRHLFSLVPTAQTQTWKSVWGFHLPPEDCKLINIKSASYFLSPSIVPVQANLISEMEQ